MWREIPGHVGYYAKKNGKVARRLRSKSRTNEYKLLRPFYGKKGGGGILTLYTTNGKRHYRKVSQLILETFGRQRQSSSSWAMHKNGDVTDDRFENLVWREKGEIRVSHEASTGNFRAHVGSTDIGSWPTEQAARKAARKFRKTGEV